MISAANLQTARLSITRASLCQPGRTGTGCRRAQFGPAPGTTSNIGFEGELGHLFDIVGDDEAVDWSVTNFSGNFIYHFDVKHVTPYATFGIGFEHSGYWRVYAGLTFRLGK